MGLYYLLAFNVILRRGRGGRAGRGGGFGLKIRRTREEEPVFIYMLVFPLLSFFFFFLSFALTHYGVWSGLTCSDLHRAVHQSHTYSLRGYITISAAQAGSARWLLLLGGSDNHARKQNILMEEYSTLGGVVQVTRKVKRVS